MPRVGWDQVSVWCVRAVVVLALVGLAVSTYLSIGVVTGTGPACRVGGGCEVVIGSEYSRIAGLPVAFIGVAGYSALLIGTLAVAGNIVVSGKSRLLLLAMAAIGFLFSMYLTATQALFIGEFCIYCLTSAVVMTAITVLLALSVVANRHESRS